MFLWLGGRVNGGLQAVAGHLTPGSGFQTGGSSACLLFSAIMPPAMLHCYALPTPTLPQPTLPHPSLLLEPGAALLCHPRRPRQPVRRPPPLQAPLLPGGGRQCRGRGLRCGGVGCYGGSAAGHHRSTSPDTNTLQNVASLPSPCQSTHPPTLTHLTAMAPHPDPFPRLSQDNTVEFY